MLDNITLYWLDTKADEIAPLIRDFMRTQK
jgi:hypothetical protein